MKRTTLKLSDFEAQAAAILAASKARRADLRMEDVGGDDDPPDDKKDDDPDDDDDDADPDKDDDDKDDKSKKDDDKSDDKVDRAEYDRVKRHRAAADRRVAELTTENQRLTGEVAALKADGKKADGTSSSERETELTGQVQERDTTIYELRIQNAFLSANEYQWHDAGDALRLADLRDVEIEEDGTVVGIKEALQKLAKEKPHLIRASTSDKDDKDVKKGTSGSPNNGKRKGDSKKPDRATLSKTYPVLAARR